jgi:hypothetical protein
VTSIQEDDMEDSLRSASPNRGFNNKHKLLMWRTDKEISNDDYNEFSEHCSDFEQVQIYDHYINSMTRAMSQKNVAQFSFRESKNKRFHFNQKQTDDDNSVSDADSDGINSERVRDDYTRFRTQNQETIEFDLNEVMSQYDSSLNHQTSLAKDAENSLAGKHFRTNKISSCVDIDTIGGKVSLRYSY